MLRSPEKVCCGGKVVAWINLTVQNQRLFVQFIVGWSIRLYIVAKIKVQWEAGPWDLKAG